MRIDTIHIDHYGGLNDLNLDLVDGFQVIQGLNEEGKTTLLAFVRGVFWYRHGRLSKALGRSATTLTLLRFKGCLRITYRCLDRCSSHFTHSILPLSRWLIHRGAVGVSR